jgi:hypothetical protein
MRDGSENAIRATGVFLLSRDASPNTDSLSHLSATGSAAEDVARQHTHGSTMLPTVTLLTLASGANTFAESKSDECKSAKFCRCTSPPRRSSGISREVHEENAGHTQSRTANTKKPAVRGRR